MSIRKVRRLPTKYWWDFRGNAIIVESDDPKCPEVERFELSEQNADDASDKADELIRELNRTGWRSWKRATKR